jgi:hypothetical protein
MTAVVPVAFSWHKQPLACHRWPAFHRCYRLIGLAALVVIEKPSQLVANTMRLVRELAELPILIVATPIIFTPDYRELVEPVGILKTVKEVGAFRAGTKGAETIAGTARLR